MRLSLWMTAFALALPAYALEVRTEASYWRQTEVPQSLLHKFINNEKCRSSELYEKSCQAAIQAARALVGGTVVREPAAPVADFENALTALEADLPESIPVQMLRAHAIGAHLRAYDPYAGVLPLQQLFDEQNGDGQVYAGLGIVIHEVYKGGAAEAAGLKADDVILEVAKNGVEFKSLEKLGVPEVVQLILGGEGDPVGFKVKRDGRELEPFFTVRKAIRLAPSEIAMIEDGIGYLHIRGFDSEDLCDDVSAQLEKLNKKNAKKLVLDLRGNPGGEKYITLCVAELFLGEVPVMGTKYISNTIPSLKEVMGEDSIQPDSQEIEFEYGGSPAIYHGKVTVLIDSVSASGSEILAGALQDHKRAWLVGERSYGKGTAQTYEQMTGHEDLLMIWTSERFYQPSGRTNQAIGLTPSFPVSARLGRPEWPQQREADLHPNSAAPESAPWVETRPEEAQAVRDCIKTHAYDMDALKAFGKAGLPADYQKAYAVAVLKCMP
jgi:C-terminal peptidase prc